MALKTPMWRFSIRSVYIAPNARACVCRRQSTCVVIVALSTSLNISKISANICFSYLPDSFETTKPALSDRFYLIIVY